ncbi:alpha/beta fold hydrolase [Methanobacterium alcaliphilum]|uniref:alpha/beta fold hydrolase n=1 Tax=Methanobacterium alcaliphilum TaxID=392018 RepID=UPI00200A214D|nr:alpha/beta fold hydrolase [Methanobacterium alcaliphilum]
MNSEKKFPFVMVHGGNMSTETWNALAKSDDYPPGKLLGGKIWDSIVPDLKAQGHDVFSPTLQDEHVSHLNDHINEIYALIIRNNLKEVILTGHSYGGMIITAVASRIPERIRHLVYVDAALPNPGESLFDLIYSSGRDPLSFIGLEPDAPYIEKIDFEPGNLVDIHKTYILCTESEFNAVTHPIMDKIKLNPSEWNYIELKTSHIPMASIPKDFVQILLKIAAE